MHFVGFFLFCFSHFVSLFFFSPDMWKPRNSPRATDQKRKEREIFGGDGGDRRSLVGLSRRGGEGEIFCFLSTERKKKISHVERSFFSSSSSLQNFLHLWLLSLPNQRRWHAKMEAQSEHVGVAYMIFFHVGHRLAMLTR